MVPSLIMVMGRLWSDLSDASCNSFSETNLEALSRIRKEPVSRLPITIHEVYSLY